MRKIIAYLLDFLALKRMSRMGIVQIYSRSKVAYRKVQFKNDCKLIVGQDTIVEAEIAFDRDGASIKIGDRVFVGGSTLVCAENIEIGNDVLISWGCTIVDHNSHSIAWNERSQDVVNWTQGKKNWLFVKTKPVKICDRAWLGFNVILLKGVTIGIGAVVGAGSVVTKDIPPYSIAAGNPAVVIREIPEDER
jgi:galactoside O-acetyltransferase